MLILILIFRTSYENLQLKYPYVIFLVMYNSLHGMIRMKKPPLKSKQVMDAAAQYGGRDGVSTTQ